MDRRVSDEGDPSSIDIDHDDFLLREGLEVLADYRSISDDALRAAIRAFIASLAKSFKPI